MFSLQIALTPFQVAALMERNSPMLLGRLAASFCRRSIRGNRGLHSIAFANFPTCNSQNPAPTSLAGESGKYGREPCAG